MARSRQWILGVALATLLSGCGGSEQEADPPEERFLQGVDGDAGCQELFDIRNEVDPDDPIVEQMNEQLQAIGCFSSSSDRTD